MTPTHHPPTDTMMSYAAGTLPSAEACAIACHISMCPDCTADVGRLEMLAGLLLGEIEAPPADTAAAERAFTRAAAQNAPPDPAPRISDRSLPWPLSRYLDVSEPDLLWQTVHEGLEYFSVRLPDEGGHIRLWRLSPGTRLPAAPGAYGPRFVLLFQGTLRHGEDRYLPGDYFELSAGQPNWSEAIENCVCLVASSGTAAEKGWFWSIAGRISENAFAAGSQLWARTEWRPAIAASLAMLLGIGLGWTLRSGTNAIAFVPGGMVETEASRLIARGPLRTALETSRSGTIVAPVSADGAQIKISMTFQNQAGSYCRDYRIATPSPAAFRGVACRTGGEWTIVLQSIVPPHATAVDETVPAGSDAASAMNDVIAAMVRDNPLMLNEEQPLIEGGWKK
jgi:putative transcriptional regulator